MAVRSREAQDRSMSQIPGPPPTDEQQIPTESAGVNRPHLRNYEQLRRSTTDRKVAGVAGGLGRHLDIDPTILRVLFVVACFFGGAGFVAYGAAWLLVPEDGRAEGKLPTSDSTRNALLIAAGVVAALLLLGDSWNGIGFPWPLMIVGVGVLLYLAFRDRPAAGVPAAAPGVPAGEQPPAPPWAPLPAQVPAPQPPRVERGPRLFGFTVALVAVALGALGLYDVSGGSVVPSAYPALALTVIGLLLVVGAFVGRAGGLVFLGLVAAVALAVTSVLGTWGTLDGRGGERIDVVPATAADVRPSYEVTSGRVSVDLSRVSDPAALAGRTIDVRGRAAELIVVLPPGVTSRVVAGIDGPGQINLPGRTAGGIGPVLDGTYGSGTATVTIDTHLSVGHIEVRS
jgi:phage shock protein PspC (stress-responsive transcriptional regulator)